MAMVICVEAVAVITTDGIAVVDIIVGTIANDFTTHVVAKSERSLLPAIISLTPGSQIFPERFSLSRPSVNLSRAPHNVGLEFTFFRIPLMPRQDPDEPSNGELTLGMIALFILTMSLSFLLDA